MYIVIVRCNRQLDNKIDLHSRTLHMHSSNSFKTTWYRNTLKNIYVQLQCNVIIQNQVCYTPRQNKGENE